MHKNVCSLDSSDYYNHGLRGSASPVLTATGFVNVIIINKSCCSAMSRKKLQEHFTAEKNKTNNSVTRVEAVSQTVRDQMSG